MFLYTEDMQSEIIGKATIIQKHGTNKADLKPALGL